MYSSDRARRPLSLRPILWALVYLLTPAADQPHRQIRQSTQTESRQRLAAFKAQPATLAAEYLEHQRVPFPYAPREHLGPRGIEHDYHPIVITGASDQMAKAPVRYAIDP